jgi:hypothetical protein
MNEAVFPAKLAKSNRERVTLERLPINERGDEFIEVEKPLANKINKLLESQQALASHDVEAFFEAADNIQGANCHKTALYLTGEYTESQLFAKDNDNPETAGHFFVEAHTEVFDSLEEAQTHLQNLHFPFRISFFKPKDGIDFAYHSITLLGTSNKDRLIGFEKEGPYADNRFRYINALSTIVRYAGEGYRIGLETL